MFAAQLAAAIEAVRPSQTDDISRTLWKAHAAGLVDDAEAEQLAAAIEARRVIGKVPAERPAPRRVGSRPRSSASLERRRRWVAAGLMPPQVAASFTMGEAAVLAVIAAECAKKRVCSLAMAAIAALAGVCETTVRNSLRRAKVLGLIVVQERRLTRWRNATNLISITSPEWKTWLRIGEKRTSGGWAQNRAPDPYDSHLRPVFAPFAGQGRRVGSLPPAARR